MLNKKYVTNENYTELLLAHTQSVSLNQQNREEMFFPYNSKENCWLIRQHVKIDTFYFNFLMLILDFGQRNTLSQRFSFVNYFMLQSIN